MKFSRFIFSIYGLFTFVLVMLLILPLAMMTLFFGRIEGGNLLYRICGIWARIWYLFTGMRHEDVYVTPDEPERQFVFIANHGSYMDIPPLVLALRQPIRVLGKYEMVRYPIFGWIYRMAVIVVDRRSPEMRARSLRALKATLRKGISIFIFPEGTFNETEKPLKEMYNGAFRLAIEMQVPLRILLFPDAEKRLFGSSLFSLNPGPNRVIHLETIETEGMTLQAVEALKAKTTVVMEAGLIKYRK